MLILPHMDNKQKFSSALIYLMYSSSVDSDKACR